MSDQNYIDWAKSKKIPQLYKMNVLALLFVVLGAMLFERVSFIIYLGLIMLPFCYLVENVWKIPYSFIFQYIRTFIFGKIKSPRKR